MGKKYNPSKISKKQQAQNKRAGLSDIWIDGCYYPEQELAGGAGVICDADGKVQSTLSFELNHLPISESDHAELWTAAYILDSLAQNSIARLSSDCPSVISSIKKIRTGKQTKIFDVQLLHKLTNAVNRQPQMALNQVTRGVGKIPMADRFAKAAARNDENEMKTATRESGNRSHTHTQSFDL